jgi:hypothetical protein
MVNVSISVELEELLKNVNEGHVIGWLKKKGYAVMSPAELRGFVNIEKSLGTVAFYTMLAEAIEQGKLSLEMIVGYVATRKLMKTVEEKVNKPQ